MPMKTPLLVLCPLLLASGCSSTTPGWDATFGEAVREARVRQLIDPTASARSANTEGVDGKAAAGALKTYANSYGYAVREPRPAVLQSPLGISSGR